MIPLITRLTCLFTFLPSVPIKNLFNYLEEGETIEEILEDFPSVKREQSFVTDEQVYFHADLPSEGGERLR